MIYTSQHCEDIRAGRKTQSRRVCKEGEFGGEIAVFRTDPKWAWSANGGINAQHTPFSRPRYVTKWQVGRDYAIQDGRGHKGDGRTLLLGLRREPLQDISLEDIEAEGVDVVAVLPSPLHPAAQKMTSDAILFLARHAFAEMWDAINKRKGERWADDPDVWVHTFSYVEGS